MKFCGFFSGKMLKGRRAVSPLIATVLLIAFAVALGAVVMSWGKNYVQSTTEYTEQTSNAQIRCSLDVKWGILSTDTTTEFCRVISTNATTFMLENNGATPILLNVTSVGATTGAEVNSTAYLMPGEVKSGSITPRAGDTIIRFIPFIVQGSKLVICNNIIVSKKIADIGPC